MTALMGQSLLVTLALYVAVGTVAAARLTRLVVNDDFPPVVKFRVWWDGRVRGLWNKLVHCPFCFSFWATCFVMFTAWLCDYFGVQLIWWIVMGALAASYVSAWLVFHDEDA